MHYPTKAPIFQGFKVYAGLPVRGTDSSHLDSSCSGNIAAGDLTVQSNFTTLVLSLVPNPIIITRGSQGTLGAQPLYVTFDHQACKTATYSHGHGNVVSTTQVITTHSATSLVPYSKLLTRMFHVMIGTQSLCFSSEPQANGRLTDTQCKSHGYAILAITEIINQSVRSLIPNPTTIIRVWHEKFDDLHNGLKYHLQKVVLRCKRKEKDALTPQDPDMQSAISLVPLSTFITRIWHLKADLSPATFSSQPYQTGNGSLTLRLGQEY